MILLGMFAAWSSPFHIHWPWWSWLVVFLGEWASAILREWSAMNKCKTEAIKLQNILENRK